ncbi:BTB/POZ domain-containing adapter for CUL3-mediated RhoA degradation protein 3-like [Oopsacas minuta]|uniref:BTB/POZ domain-containing adapter for CUL3-mediated RhoA degradation protein 3-like n=1 Tax=Oopsacas minuta TaxID=111878 RepID=A0AAV7JES2_9METZ|nr:BTB/POZ domain-containing adapter for CUL3-mediated RhoA degradation protein 3-like [Oopsacas minuta]
MASNAASLDSVKTRVSRIESMHISPTYSDHYTHPYYSTMPSKHTIYSTPPPVKSHKYVKLNIGGMLYVTTLDTLTREDSMLRAMFSGRMNMDKDEEGWVLIDRDGKHFGFILNYLRNGEISLPESRQLCEEILTEAKYYLLDGLVERLSLHCRKLLEDLSICKVPVISSPEEEQLLLSSSAKPVIKFLYNRNNNKYSYTNNSDENFLRNIELFDKLSLRFCGRVLFIKDVVGHSAHGAEICCWSFYGHGKKVSEVECESISYGTEKKQTKIEFPEARILEETLNIMLYEDNVQEISRTRAANLRAANRAARAAAVREPEPVIIDDDLLVSS